MVSNSSDKLFKRYEGNPILTKFMWPYPVNGVFNPAAVQIKDETLLLVRAEDFCGFSHLTVARSADGKNDWYIDKKPTLKADPELGEREWGIEDPRIVWLKEDNAYAITYVSFHEDGPEIALTLTEDFKHFHYKGILLPPENKDGALFPKKVGGRYVLLHRPIVRGERHIWVTFSRDLKYWGYNGVLMPTRPGSWDCSWIGIGPPPIETKEGWLMIYHGTRVTAAGSLYRVGLAMLDLEEPWKVTHRSREWVFGPEANYEQIGDVPGVTFPAGAIYDRASNELRLYYGAADTSVALAMADMDDVLAYITSPSNKV